MAGLFHCTTLVYREWGVNLYCYLPSNCARAFRVRPRVEIWGIDFRELRIK